MRIFADYCVKFVASDTSVQTGQLILRHHRYLSKLSLSSMLSLKNSANGVEIGLWQ